MQLELPVAVGQPVARMYVQICPFTQTTAGERAARARWTKQMDKTMGSRLMRCGMFWTVRAAIAILACSMTTWKIAASDDLPTISHTHPASLQPRYSRKGT